MSGQLGQPVVARRVERVAVIPELNEHISGADDVDQLIEDPPRNSRTVGHQWTGDQTFSPSGENRPLVDVTRRCLEKLPRGQTRRALLPRHLCAG